MADRPTARIIEQLFDAALALPPGERSRYLEQACDDDRLRREVESLLAAHDGAGDFLGETVAELTDVERADSRGSERQVFIGPYQLLQKLGEGETSTVYRAVRSDAGFRMMVAVKVLNRGVDSEGILRRFHQERQILAALDHPNIAHLLDGGQTDDGRPYFVMELVEGDPIDAYCDRVGLSLNERIDLFRSVCEAVHHAHRSLVVHRDLKPGNILITTRGEPKLLDFGIAKLMDPELALARTATAARLMTPRYASPEQVRGEPITTATDVYSLGVLLYELLTGRPPYDLRAPSITEIERAICDSRPEPPSTVAGGADRRRLEGDLDTIVLTALRKEPERRYGSVHELSEDLRRYRQRLPVKARPDTLGYRAGKFLRRNAIAVVATAVVATTLVAGVAVSVWQARLARAAQTRAERVSEFMVNLFQVSDPGEARGNSVTAREILDRGVAEITGGLEDQPEVKEELLETMALVYSNLGLYDRALELSEQRVEIGRRLWGDGRAELGPAVNDLGVLLYQMGRFDEAAEHFRRALPALEELHGDDDVNVATTINNLAMALMEQGRFEEAEPMAREALAAHRAILDKDDPQIAIDVNNLALVLAKQGRHEESVVMRRDAVELVRRAYGEDHPTLALAMSNLASDLHDLGQDEEAEQYERQALTLLRRVVGDSHPDTALLAQNLATTMARLGDYEEAERLYREALAVQREAFGEKHARNALAMSNLAATLSAQARYDDADQLFLEVLEMRRELLGDEHPDTAQTLSFVAAAAYRRGEVEEAERMYRRSLEVLLATLPPAHSRIASARVGLGSLLTESGRPEEAEPLLVEALASRRRGTPDGALELPRAEGALGACLTALGRYQEAEPLLLASRDGYAAPTARADHRRLALDRLVDLYQAWGRLEEAAGYGAQLESGGGL